MSHPRLSGKPKRTRAHPHAPSAMYNFLRKLCQCTLLDAFFYWPFPRVASNVLLSAHRRHRVEGALSLFVCHTPLHDWNGASCTALLLGLCVSCCVLGCAAVTPLTDANIVSAVNNWISSPTTAATTYGGPIGGWNVAAVSNMLELFQFKRTFN